MPKETTAYFCRECGYESSGWLGRCPNCHAWNSMVEERRATGATAAANPRRRVEEGWLGAAIDRAGDGASEAIALDEVKPDAAQRVSSGIPELDRVLGSGFVRGSLVLVGGDPGIGKSTLLLQVCASQQFHGPILYVSGEESPQQIKLRADRLNVRGKGIRLLPEICFERIAEVIKRLRPAFCIIDSIQTLYSESLSAAPGSVSQVREVTAALLRMAKRFGTTIVLVGHVTKEGSLAGPRVLEHMVDTVLYFEGEASGALRILRSVKNRFGATNELGIFEMRSEGLVAAPDASLALLAQRPEEVPGSAVSCCLEGTRPLMVEIQALAVVSGYGQPQRTVQGLERGRLQMIMAVMENKLDYPCNDKDVFVNAVGGIRIQDPATDLALAAALASSMKKRPLRPHFLLLGELGLTGELRAVNGAEPRVREAIRLGYRTCILPGASRKAMQKLEREHRGEGEPGIDLIYADSLGEALDVAFSTDSTQG